MQTNLTSNILITGLKIKIEEFFLYIKKKSMLTKLENTLEWGTMDEHVSHLKEN